MTAADTLYSSYAFTSINAQLRVKSGDVNAAPLACVEATITPDLGRQISDTLSYLPLAILVLVAISTASAAIYSPWGSTDVFKFTSNYGRDDDLLRLVTPGFGDCLQYIQFIFLAGSLSLNYPGFFQPVVSQVSWAALMFNESFVSKGAGYQSVVHGMYVVNGTYGLDRMSQLVGMTKDEDIWAGMAVWLLVIVVAVLFLIQVGFASRWAYRFISDTREEDLRQKNWPFSVGNTIRIVYGYFLLPVVTLSAFQLVIASQSPNYVVIIAALLIVALVGFAGFLLWLVATTRPRSYLFDDLPTVLQYGPLYNTYSDNAATFALVPIMLTFLRGIAIGAVQPSGIAQIVLLAICEVIAILTLNAFRPFHSPTSMNLFHTLFAVARLLTVLLSTVFLPSLSVNEAAKGWVGYVILLMHGIVLVFGFFLNACQTLVEVLARLAGAGGEDTNGVAARGGLVKVSHFPSKKDFHSSHYDFGSLTTDAQVFGMRQLSRRNPRAAGRAARQSVSSDAAILTSEHDQKSLQWNGNRSRSVSGSSAILLNSHGRPARQSMGLESVSAGGAGDTPTSGGASTFSYMPGSSQAGGQGGIFNIKAAETADPYYRPPRPRRTTIENEVHQQARVRVSIGSSDWANQRWSQHSPDVEGSPMRAGAPTLSGRDTPVPAHLGSNRERSDSKGEDVDDGRVSKTDYATREVDFYYGVRGPALSNVPTRRLKTGPADPTGPVSSAAGWFQRLLGGKTKEKGKGFEVVRSSRAPPTTGRRAQSGAMAAGGDAPYTDDPAGSQQPERSRDLALSDEGDAIGAGTRHLPEEEIPSSTGSDEEGTHHGSMSDDEDWRDNRRSQISPFPPSLPTIETPGGIELPSRIASNASSKHPSVQSARENAQVSRAPTVPRKSSRRDSSTDFGKLGHRKLSTIAASPASTPRQSARLQASVDRSSRIPFESHRKSPSHTTHLSAGGQSMGTSSSMYPDSLEGTDDDIPGHTRHSSSLFGGLDRPTSMGYVQQHRASDNIHFTSPIRGDLVGSSAELVEDSQPSPDPGIGHAM